MPNGDKCSSKGNEQGTEREKVGEKYLPWIGGGSWARSFWVPFIA